MNPKWLYLFLLLRISTSARITGEWNPKEDKVQIVSKFGFQQSSPTVSRNSRGYLYGFITTDDSTFDYLNPYLLTLVSQKHIDTFRKTSEYQPSCGVLLQQLSSNGFESRCFPNGTTDVFRSIPCPKGHLCKEEDTPTNVIVGYQMTIQVYEPITPEYWYVVLLACRLNDNCTWVENTKSTVIKYDLWMTNGKPGSSESSLFKFNFSFDEQNTVEIFALSFLFYGCLYLVVTHSNFKNGVNHSKTRFLCYIINLKLVGFGLQFLNVVVFAYDGQGIFVARIIGEILRFFSVEFLCLLLLLMSRGWNVSGDVRHVDRTVYILWGSLCVINFFLLITNFYFVYDTLHDVDVFSSWPGHGMILIRLFYSVWFLTSIRKLIDKERYAEKAIFLANFGAGFMVWFISLPMIGLVTSFISPLWRFSFILALTTFSNIAALLCLTHQFWPTSSYKKFFEDSRMGHRLLRDSESHEMNEYEQILLEASSSDEDTTANSHLRDL